MSPIDKHNYWKGWVDAVGNKIEHTIGDDYDPDKCLCSECWEVPDHPYGYHYDSDRTDWENHCSKCWREYWYIAWFDNWYAKSVADCES